MLFRPVLLLLLLFMISSCTDSNSNGSINFDYKKSKYYDACLKEVTAHGLNPFQTEQESIQECVSMWREGQQE